MDTVSILANSLPMNMFAIKLFSVVLFTHNNLSLQTLVSAVAWGETGGPGSPKQLVNT